MLFGKVFNMKITFPFTKMTMKSKLYDKLNLRLNCNNMYQNIRKCAEQCYFKEKYGNGCLGFIRSKTTKKCYICNPNILASNYTDINKNHLFYILKYKKKKPVMYLPLDADNITDATVKGDGVTGTLILKGNTQVQDGKVNQGLHVSNSGRLVIDGMADECINHLEKCTNGLTVALWLKPSNIDHGSRHVTHGERSINIVVDAHGVVASWVWGQTKTIPYITSQSRVFVHTWTHIVVVYDPEVGLFLYINGTLEAFRSVDEEEPRNRNFQQYTFGSKNNGWYPIDGTLDEIKIFLRKSFRCR